MTWIPSTIVRALCWTLLHSLWQGLILALVAGAVMLFTRKAKSSTRYNLLGLLVLGFLLVSGYTFFRELQPLKTATPNPAEPGQVMLTAPVSATPEAVASQPQPGLVETMVRYFNEHAAVVVLVWLIVALARFVKVLSGVVYAQRIRHYGTRPIPAEWQERLTALLQRLRINRPVRMLESTLVKVPAVVGWLKPIVLVPAGMLAQLSPDQVESILLHELAHISRRDYLFNLVQHVIDTLFFFNPALLWVSSLIRTERENCCDDVAIRETRSRRRLIQALVSFHEYQEMGCALAFSGEKNNMVKRVERIVHKKNHSLNAGERALLMGGVLLLCGAFMTINGARKPTPLKTNVLIQAKTERKAGQIAEQKLEQMAEQKPEQMAEQHVAVSGAKTMVVASQRNVEPVNLPIKDRGNDTTKPETTKADTTRPDASKINTLTKADIDLLIRARDHGVTPEYVAELRQMGYNISLEQAIRLMDHGVSAEFIQTIKKEGFGVISVDKATELLDHGVSAEFIYEIRAEGFANLTLDKAIQLLDHGVTADFIHRVRAAGFPKLTLEQAITLVDHGVNGEFIEKWKKKTGSQLELDDYIHLRDAGIDPS
ncbi:MAG TPA: M56 family metallopeptidase [Puia sp.]|nr:M56 family metallopeptidase [Puia sp.]